MTVLGPVAQMPTNAGIVADPSSAIESMPGAATPGGAAVADAQPARVGNDLEADFLHRVDGLSAGLRSDAADPAQGVDADGLFDRAALRAGDPSAMTPQSSAPRNWDDMKDVVRQAEQEMRADMTFSVNANMLSTSSQSVGKTRDDLMKEG